MTADEQARQVRVQLERELLEALYAYDRLASKKLKQWGISDDDE